MFYKIENLEKDIENGNYNYIPKKQGIYRVLKTDDEKITFLDNTKNPNFKPYQVAKLQDKYNKTKSSKVLYIGKAVNLHNRIKQYIKYGLNLANNHKGGRAIFQIKDYKKLVIEVILCDRCECVEKNMLIGFKENFNELPVANMKI